MDERGSSTTVDVAEQLAPARAARQDTTLKPSGSPRAARQAPRRRPPRKQRSRRPAKAGLARPSGRARPRVARRPATNAIESVLAATRLLLGAVVVGARLVRGVPGTEPRPPTRPAYPAAVAVGLVFEAERRLLARVSPLLTPPARVASFARRRLDPWYARGEAELRRSEEAAERAWRHLLAAIVADVLVEVNVDAVVDRVDLERIVDHLDFEHIVDRIDLPRVTREVLEVADVNQIVRDSTHSLADESVDSLRLQGMTADRAVGRAVDRLLRRNGDGRRG